MEKNSFKPQGILSSYIDRFYELKHTNKLAFSMPIILPGTGLELLFYMDEVLSVKNQKLNKSHIICPRKVFEFDKTQAVNYISVRFKSGGFRHFTNIPFTELNDKYLSIEDIWKNEGVELLEKLQEQKTITERIKLIEEFLIVQLSKNQIKVDVKWDTIITDLYKNYKTLSLSELSKKANLSHRQFERKFKQQFGITAKKFQKTARFQDTIKGVLLQKKEYYLDVILENGYFDQSHFINEFQSFVGLKPTAYFIKDNFENNLYYKSIRQG